MLNVEPQTPLKKGVQNVTEDKQKWTQIMKKQQEQFNKLKSENMEKNRNILNSLKDSLDDQLRVSLDTDHRIKAQ